MGGGEMFSSVSFDGSSSASLEGQLDICL
jgi:hypothetical protein